MKITEVKWKGTVYAIPNMWLIGRSSIRRMDGMDPIAAYLAAIQDWIEQAELEKRYKEGT